MKSRSSKAKGRKFQQEIREAILKKFPSIHEDDIKVALMGENGEDIKLSNKARELLPYSIEAKNRESINIWEAIKQATLNANKHTPLVIFRRNNEKPYVVVSFEHFLQLIDRNPETNINIFHHPV